MSTSASPEQKETQPAATPATDVNAMESALRQAAQKMDRGEEVQDTDLHPVQSTDGDGKKPATESSGRKTDAELASEKKAADEKKATEDAAKAKADKEAAEKKAAEDQKNETPYQKAQRKAAEERERYDRNWKKFQEDQQKWKDDVAKKERELAERERRLNDGGARRQTGPVKDKDGYTADQWEKAASQWEKEGKFELADSAKEAAKKLREQEQRGGGEQQQRDNRPATRPEDTPRTPEFERKWNENLVKLIATEGFADLGKKDSELFKATATILQSDPRFSQFNDGIMFAAELARARLEASSASALRTTIQEQTKELEKLRKATSPGGGDGAESRGEAKSFENLSPAEQERELAKAAREVDTGTG